MQRPSQGFNRNGARSVASRAGMEHRVFPGEPSCRDTIPSSSTSALSIGSGRNGLEQPLAVSPIRAPHGHKRSCSRAIISSKPWMTNFRRSTLRSIGSTRLALRQAQGDMVRDAAQGAFDVHFRRRELRRRSARAAIGCASGSRFLRACWRSRKGRPCRRTSAKPLQFAPSSTTRWLRIARSWPRTNYRPIPSRRHADDKSSG